MADKSKSQKSLFVIVLAVTIVLTIGEIVFLFWGRRSISPVLWLPILLPIACLWALVVPAFWRAARK